MQEWCEDFSLLCHDEGCCLYCSKSSPGCLCFDCKCRKCYWYNNEGWCEKTEILKKEAKKRFIEEIKRKEEIKNNNWKEFKKEQEILEKEMRTQEKIINFYSCQKCQKEFITEKDFKIILNKFPLCKFCEKKWK